MGATAAIKPEIESSMEQQWIDWNDHYLASVYFSENEQVSCANGNRQNENEKKNFYLLNSFGSFRKANATILTNK